MEHISLNPKSNVAIVLNFVGRFLCNIINFQCILKGIKKTSYYSDISDDTEPVFNLEECL